ncbi:Ankyrin repeat-containing domain protein, partial [Elaphomyces granulatus]
QVGMNGFHMAINQGYDQTTEALLRVGVSPGQCTDRGLTSLQIATQQHHAHLIPLLIRGGADPNAKSVISPKTAMKHPEYALEGHKMGIVEILLESGANANAPLMYGRTPLHYAAALGQEQTARLLLSHGANPLAADHV